MNKKILYPIGLLVLIFLLDKLVLIPYFQKCCVEIGVRDFFVETEKSKEIKWMKLSNAKKEGKNTIASFGSSLSHGFFFTKHKLFSESNEYVKDKSLFEKTEIVNYAYPGASSLTYFVRLNQLLDSGNKPDLILLEVGPHTLNTKTPWYYFETREVINFDFVIKYITKLDNQNLYDWLLSRIFVSSYYKIGIYKSDSAMAREYFRKFIEDDMDQKLIEPGPATKSGEENIGVALSKGLVIAELKKRFQSYNIDPVLKKYLQFTINRIEEEKIPFIIWHPLVQEYALDSSYLLIGSDWNSYIDTDLKKYNYIDLNTLEGRKCDYFIDPIHAGVQCYGEFLEIILKNKSHQK